MTLSDWLARRSSRYGTGSRRLHLTSPDGGFAQGARHVDGSDAVADLGQTIGSFPPFQETVQT